MVSIKGLPKAAVFKALYDASRPLGFGFREFVPGPMPREEAEQVTLELARTEQPLFFGYYRGRVMKVDITGDEFEPRLYDRDNGEGAAQKAVNRINQEVEA